MVWIPQPQRGQQLTSKQVTMYIDLKKEEALWAFIPPYVLFKISEPSTNVFDIS